MVIASISVVQTDQELAVCDFQAATNIADITTSGWDCVNGTPTSDVCSGEWDGIGCYEDLLVSLKFSYDDSLSGTLPSSIGKLSDLTYLQYYETSMYGTLPTTIGQLIKLQYFSIKLFLSFRDYSY